MSSRLPDGWRNAKIGDIADVIGGGTPARKSPIYWGGHIAWATPSDVTRLRGRTISTTAARITEEGLRASSATILPRRSLLVTTRATIGACSINDIPMATSQGFQCLVPRAEVKVEFLLYAIVHNRDALMRLSGGSTFFEVSKRAISGLSIKLPPLCEQLKIAAILAAADEAIERTQGVMDELYALRKALMQELLTRGIPGRHRRFKQTEVGEIPAGWDVRAVYEVCEVHDHLRRPLNSKERSGMSGPYPYYGATKLLDKINQYRVEGTYALIGEDGDHFLKFDAWPMTQLVSGRFNVNNHAHLVIGTELCRTEWFYHYFRHRDIGIYLTRQGANRYKLRKSTLLEFRIPLPSVEEQMEIAAMLDVLDHAVQRERSYLEEQRVIKSALLSLLLTGEIRVTPDPEPTP